ncbi:MAG TPA: DUF302 domain-containing protein [Acidimicrobiales bacterium]|jgi:uncharacterized protein (DUF302 family)|nr:DUF302 domain-containing protein [Acidimicrobiales bacterium]
MPESPTPDPESGIITKQAAGTVADTVSKLTELVDARGMKIFTVIDHSGEAEQAGLELPDTKLVIFGSPAAGTPIMQASRLVALDLPLKVLVWDEGGQTNISYTDPEVLAAHHHLSNDLAARLAGIGPLTDALTG